MISVADGGAVGDGLTDCTQAFLWAAANDRRIEVPAGRWKCGPLQLPGDVGITGAGRFDTSIEVDSTTEDALSITSDVAYGRGGHLRDLAVVGGRDGVSLSNIGHFDLTGVRVDGAARHGLYGNFLLDVVADHLLVSRSGQACVKITDATASTSVRFRESYFSQGGTAGTDVAGLGVRFAGCIWESNGGPGLVVRSGQVWVDGGYFENNEGDDVHAGTVAATHFTMVGHSSLTGASTAAGAHLRLGPHVRSAVLLGGGYDRRSSSIVIDPAARGIFGAGLSWGPNDPEMSDGSDIDASPWGSIVGPEAASGRIRTWGRVDLYARYIVMQGERFTLPGNGYVQHVAD